jgi:hypothetical protein
LRRRCRGEAGTSLILALAFLMVFGILIPAILDLGTTDVLATSKLSAQRGSAYAADGATDGAIQYLRLHQSCGRPAPIPSCGDFTWTDGPDSTVVRMTSLNTDLLQLDREVELEASVDGTPRVTATVLIKDSDQDAVAGDQPVEIEKWHYSR